MVWARLDDELLDNPKVAKVGPIGFAVYVAGIVWCSRNLTDGHIPFGRANALLDLSAVEYDVGNPCAVPGGPSTMASDNGLTVHKVAETLIAAGLWSRTEDGYLVHDFLKHNPSRASVLLERDAVSAVKAKAGHIGGLRSAEVRRLKQTASKTEADAKQTGKQTPSKKEAPIPYPIPRDHGYQDPPLVLEPSNQPGASVPADSSAGRRTPGKTTLPADWTPPAADVDRLRAELGRDVMAALPGFRDYWRGHGKRMADWAATFRNWVRRDATRLPEWYPPPVQAAPPSPVDAEEARAARAKAVVAIGALLAKTAPTLPGMFDVDTDTPPDTPAPRPGATETRRAVVGGGVVAPAVPGGPGASSGHGGGRP